jgi:hypothetical protein
MEVAAPRNPNICAGCAQLLEDDSPVSAAQAEQGNAFFFESMAVESTVDRSSPDDTDQVSRSS